MATARECLNGDEPGLGKTIETLGALIEGGVTGPVLVLAPRTSCRVVWEPEIKRWLADDVPFTVTQTAGLNPAKREAAWQSFQDNLGATAGTEWNGIHFLIANAEQVGIKRDTECPADICNGDEDWCPEFASHKNRSTTRRPFLHSIEWSAIVADETHKWLINSRGKRASQVGYGFTKLRTVEGGMRFALSGTPLKGKKHNLFGTINWLRPKTYTSKWRWAETYFIVTKDQVDAGRKGIIETKTIGDLNKAKQEAFFRSLNAIMIRRTKSELRKVNPEWAPPEKRYHDIWVDMEPAQKRHYLAMEKKTEVELNGGTLSATGLLAVMTRLRQFANSDGELIDGTFHPVLPSSKFDWLMQFLEERGIEAGGDLSDDVHKVVVASQFTKQVNAWAAELTGKGIACHVLTGETSDKKREELVIDFQNNPDVRVFFINTMAGGVSITLDAADDLVIMDETWVPDDQIQVEDRVHRASNVEHQVDIWYVRTKGTIEEGLASTNEGKALSNHVVLDAQRGLRFASERFGAVASDHATWSKKKGKVK
jgi:SNF2 family DNA or RNA helicase